MKIYEDEQEKNKALQETVDKLIVENRMLKLTENNDCGEENN